MEPPASAHRARSPSVAYSDSLRFTRAVLDRYVERENGCWDYTGGRDRTGYGKVSLRSDDGRRTSCNAHRAFYVALVGPIPSGMQLDHLCRNPSCVNPAHLEPVTNGENARRGWAANVRDACKHGHPWAPETTKIPADGIRRCLVCARERDAAYRRRWRAKNPDRVRAYNRSYYLANRTVLIETQRIRRARGKEG